LWPLNSTDLNVVRNSATSPRDKMQDVSDLMQRLIDVWAGVEVRVIQDVIE